jgi:hypothetical protein
LETIDALPFIDFEVLEENIKENGSKEVLKT